MGVSVGVGLGSLEVSLEACISIRVCIISMPYPSFPHGRSPSTGQPRAANAPTTACATASPAPAPASEATPPVSTIKTVALAYVAAIHLVALVGLDLRLLTPSPAIGKSHMVIRPHVPQQRRRPLRG